MKFKIMIIVLWSIVLFSYSHATKRHNKVTGKSCKFCHRSKKGGDRNLNNIGKEYKIFLKDKKRIRRKKKTKLNYKQVQIWKSIIKKNRIQQRKTK
jgi:hypothetical protein